MSINSAKILADYCSGDSVAATALFDRYVDRLLALAKARLGEKLRPRLDPDDVVQSVFRSFFAKADRDEVVLRRPGDLWRLLAAMTVHKSLGRVEREFALKRHPGAETRDAAIERIIESEPAPDHAVIFLDDIRAFIAGLTHLPGRVFELRLQGESTGEIAAEVSLSEASVRRILRDVKRQLGDRLSAD